MNSCLDVFWDDWLAWIFIFTIHGGGCAQRKAKWVFMIIYLAGWKSSNKWNCGKYCIIQSLSGEERAAECSSASRKAFFFMKLLQQAHAVSLPGRATAVPDEQQHNCEEIQHSTQVGWFPTQNSVKLFPNPPAHMCMCVGMLHKGHAYPGSPEGTLNDCVRRWRRTLECPKAAFLWKIYVIFYLLQHLGQKLELMI